MVASSKKKRYRPKVPTTREWQVDTTLKWKERHMKVPDSLQWTLIPARRLTFWSSQTRNHSVQEWNPSASLKNTKPPRRDPRTPSLWNQWGLQFPAGNLLSHLSVKSSKAEAHLMMQLTFWCKQTVTGRPTPPLTPQGPPNPCCHQPAVPSKSTGRDQLRTPESEVEWPVKRTFTCITARDSAPHLWESSPPLAWARFQTGALRAVSWPTPGFQRNAQVQAEHSQDPGFLWWKE